MAPAIIHWPPLYSLTKHARFCEPGVVTVFPTPSFICLSENYSKRIGGKLVGFSSVKDVDFIQCNLKSVSICSYHWLFFWVKSIQSLPCSAMVQWRNFARGCPWGRDGWVPHWLRSACAKCKKSKRASCASLQAWGPGARLRAPLGPGAKPLVGVQGAKPPEAPVHFNADTAFPTQTYIRHWDC